MRSLLSIVIITVLAGSCHDARVTRYKEIVDSTDRIVVMHSFSDSTVITTPPLLENFKKVLKRNIKADRVQKIEFGNGIFLYNQNKVIGLLVLSPESKPYVNFFYEDRGFSFGLTYGIGRFVEELQATYSSTESIKPIDSLQFRQTYSNGTGKPDSRWDGIRSPKIRLIDPAKGPLLDRLISEDIVVGDSLDLSKVWNIDTILVEPQSQTQYNFKIEWLGNLHTYKMSKSSQLQRTLLLPGEAGMEYYVTQLKSSRQNEKEVIIVRKYYFIGGYSYFVYLFQLKH